ncbi:Ni/Fe-hydrogenase, b-type cytochrome subunit [Roseovarius sp.]|uniref:Ni/Fe-hydrogenase, b-type cytochrome subunit n=1 Tax=Roseovarius sp. TaxID=1486281 RepID=UPI0035662AC4
MSVQPDTDTPFHQAGTHKQTSVYVYEAPVRIWHWVNALAILVLCLTGYFIGQPLPSFSGAEATYQFFFGYLRFAHFAAGMVLTVAFFGRAYWALVGNHHAKQLFSFPFWKRHFWAEVWFELRWYLFLEREPKKYEGHNPLAQMAMFFFITIATLFMIVTGFALYAEGVGKSHWMYTAFGWVIELAGNSLDVHMLHRMGMYTILVFVIIHIYVAVREDIMSRQSIVSTMISGHRTFKDDRPD